MKVFITLHPDQTVCSSVRAEYDEDGNLFVPANREGPFEVPENYLDELHLYRLKDGKLVKDEELARKLAKRSREIEILNQRNILLAATDYLLMPDYPISGEKRADIIAYRQALRDITKQPGHPENINWPKSPV